MTRTRTGLVLVPGLLLALTLAVAGCGGGGGKSGGVASLTGSTKATPTTSAGGSSDPKQAARDWARCMRQHGINLPDPNIDANEGFAGLLPEGVNPDDPKFKAAQQACQQSAPSGGQPPTRNQQQRQQQLQLARCMRQHGINMPDPDANGGTDMSRSGVDPDGPTFKAAEQACRQYQPNRGNQQTSSGGGR
jgi:hypothetical protein